MLRESGVPIKMDGRTRFDEPIVRGIIGPVTDSSIDELMSAREVVVDGAARPGPGAETVLVLETPAAALPLAQRVAAQAALLKRLLDPPARDARRLLTGSGCNRPRAPKALFNEAIGLIRPAELGAAEARCRAALERHPGDVNMQALLGALLDQAGAAPRGGGRCCAR